MPYSLKEHRAQYNRDRRAWYIEHGICARCCREFAEPGHVHCRKCLQHEIDRRVKTRARDNAKHRELRQERIAKGLCPYCGKPATNGMKSCDRCRAMRRDSVRKYKILQRMDKQAERMREWKKGQSTVMP